MDYLKIKCFHCGNKFELYSRSMNLDAYFTFAEVNKNFCKYHEDRGEMLFQVELRNHYVNPDDIIFHD